MESNSGRIFTTHPLEQSQQEEIFYEVSFKCSIKLHISNMHYDIGDMVIVSAEKGTNIGFIYREVSILEVHSQITENISYPTERILSKIPKEDEPIRSFLLTKISHECHALSRCLWIMRGHRSGQVIDIFATEFQFDNKKLYVFLKKREEISVCRLVRKLYETFKMKIKVVEVEGFEVLQEVASKYLAISRLDVSLMEIFTPSSPPLTPQPSRQKQSVNVATTYPVQYSQYYSSHQFGIGVSPQPPIQHNSSQYTSTGLSTNGTRDSNTSRVSGLLGPLIRLSPPNVSLLHNSSSLGSPYMPGDTFIHRDSTSNLPNFTNTSFVVPPQQAQVLSQNHLPLNSQQYNEFQSFSSSIGGIFSIEDQFENYHQPT